MFDARLAVGAPTGGRARIQPGKLDRLTAFDADADFAAQDAVTRRRDVRELAHAPIDPAALQSELGANEGLVYVVAYGALEPCQALGLYPVLLDGKRCQEFALTVTKLPKQPAYRMVGKRPRRRLRNRSLDSSP